MSVKPHFLRRNIFSCRDYDELIANYSGYRALKLDGAFFEEYATLNDKQEGLIEEARQGTLKREAQQSIPDSYHGKVFVPPDKAKALELYKELVYTVVFRLGKKKQGGDALTDHEIFTYGRQALNISSDEHKDILQEVKTMKAPTCYLNLKVIAGEDLDPKDANGLSDPYCMMCIINNGEGEKTSDNGNKRKKKLLRQFKQEDDVKLTKIKMKTLNPEWKQYFKFNVTDVQNQVLRLDVWDKDDNTVVLDADNTITSIKGFRGAGRFFKEIVQATKSGRDTLDDFMGLLEVPLKSVPEDGLQAWFQLQPQKEKKKVGGKMLLKLSLSSKNPDETSSNISSIRSPKEVYKEFLKNFARYDCQKSINLEPGAVWDCVLVDIAQTILLQYKMQHELSPLDEAVIKWEVFSSLLQDCQLPTDFICQLLEDYRDYALLDEIDSKEEQEEFVESLDQYVKYSLNLLSKYRYVYSTAQTDACIQLGKSLMSLLVVYKLPAYKKMFPDKWLTKDIEEVIEKSTADWFAVMTAYHQALENNPYETLHQMVNITNTVNGDLKRGEENYKPIFDIVRIPYMRIVFNKLEILLASLIKIKTENLNTEFNTRSEKNHELGTAMFELYLAVKDLYNLKQTIPKEEQNVGFFDNYSEWFKKGVVKWLDMASVKAEERIVKAVEFDEVQVIDSMVKHSTSAVDVSCCLGQICKFWHRLDWPDPCGAYMFLTQITGIVGKCAMDYGGIVLHQLKDKGFYDDVGQFDVTDQLCIMMNNIAHVLQFLEYVPEALSYEKVVVAMTSVEDRSTDQLNGTLQNILNCAKDDMHNKLDKIIDHIIARMKESLYIYLVKIITQEGRNASQVSDPLLEYIDSNLVTLSSALLTQVFESILEHFWDMFLSSLLDLMKRNEKKLQQVHFLKINEILEIALEFFHGNGDGIAFPKLMSDNYKEVSKTLQLNKGSTEELIERFYMDRCDEQKAVDSNLGSLTFKAFYDNKTSHINVYVMNCKNLLPMDNSGSSDPYVTLQLLPHHLFPTIKKKKTKVQKNTLYPLFDDAFQFEIPPPDCLKQGATLVFTIYDQDRVVDDDIAGEVYFDLQNVVGLNVESVAGSFATVPQIEMPLMIGAFKSDTVKVLKSRRPQDQLAVQFVQKQKQRLKEMNDNVQKAIRQMADRKK